MPNNITHGGRIVNWLRSQPSDARSIHFTTREAAEGANYTMTHASSALTELVLSQQYGILRIKPGQYSYSHRVDAAGRRDVKEGAKMDHYVSQRVIQYVQARPGQALSITDVTEAVDALRSSVSNALREASENELTGIVKITRGLYKFDPSRTPVQPVPVVPTPAQVFPSGVSVSPGPMAGKTHTELRARSLQQESRSVQDIVASAQQAPQPPADPFTVYRPTVGDAFKVIATEPLLVRARDGKVYKLVEL